MDHARLNAPGTPGQSLPLPARVPDGHSAETLTTRELFWQNVLQEMLTGLSALSAQGAQRDLFDGRLAIITTLGHRIPIGDIAPLFACGISGTDAEKSLSTAVECSVFQVRTPDGEVFTLPLHEMRMFHSLTEELVERVKAAARAAEGRDSPSDAPFGFAAFTTLARQRGTPPEGGIIGPGLPL